MSGVEIPSGKEHRAQHKTGRHVTEQVFPEVATLIGGTAARVRLHYRSIGTDALVLVRWVGTPYEAREVARRLLDAAAQAEAMLEAERRGGV